MLRLHLLEGTLLKLQRYENSKSLFPDRKLLSHQDAKVPMMLLQAGNDPDVTPVKAALDSTGRFTQVTPSHINSVELLYTLVANC